MFFSVKCEKTQGVLKKT